MERVELREKFDNVQERIGREKEKEKEEEEYVGGRVNEIRRGGREGEKMIRGGKER